MRQWLALGLMMAACSGSTTIVVSDGDTVTIAVHTVRPENRAEYARFMTEKWYPAVRRVVFGSARRSAADAKAKPTKLDSANLVPCRVPLGNGCQLSSAETP